jgi:hypothetical protein
MNDANVPKKRRWRMLPPAIVDDASFKHSPQCEMCRTSWLTPGRVARRNPHKQATQLIPEYSCGGAPKVLPGHCHYIRRNADIANSAVVSHPAGGWSSPIRCYIATAKVPVWQNKNTVVRLFGEVSTKKGQLSVTVAPMISLKRRVLELLGLVFGLVLCITTLLCSE